MWYQWTICISYSMIWWKVKGMSELYMNIWKDISLHIHKIVGCVLTIPFVKELCPNRHHPPLQWCARVFKHTLARRCPSLSFIILQISSTKRKDWRSRRWEKHWELFFGTHSTSDINCMNSNIYMASTETKERHCMSANNKSHRYMQSDH